VTWQVAPVVQRRAYLRPKKSVAVLEREGSPNVSEDDVACILPFEDRCARLDARLYYEQALVCLSN